MSSDIPQQITDAVVRLERSAGRALRIYLIRMTGRNREKCHCYLILIRPCLLRFTPAG
ncbi:MAG: hypothetical protein HY298_21550 [Verrucomicrobia bacterium]|nr:hypothetical protein [Verrucomicrobiota bacterium]